jgi:methylase of polypeptide subunit release factors
MLNDWLRALEERHLADLTFSEAARALRALSSTYVERRERLTQRSAFDSAGKRAAYALYYSPLHWITVAHIAEALQLGARGARHVLDVGCGAGAAGAAVASSVNPPARVTGVDAHPWALSEASFTYRSFALDGATMRGNVGRLHISRSVDLVVAGWVLNEVGESARDAARRALLSAAAAGVQVLIIEPIATRVSPWWREWADEWAVLGARTDEWRFRVELPDLLKRFDRAAGLRHEELTARTLFYGG